MDNSLNRMWSEYVQTPEMLDKTRELRFREIYREPLLRLLRVKPEMEIADIGCGPGTLTRKLARWLGNETLLTGIDRDLGMVEYARKKAVEMGLSNVSFLEGDALNLPLPNNSVDACVSFTVMEHIEPVGFLKEQQRVCKSGGVVAVMSIRSDRSIYSQSENHPPMSEREKKLWKPLQEILARKDGERGVCAYPLQPFEMVKIFETTGFTGIQVDGLAFQVCIDDYRNSMEDKLAIWESERQIALDGVKLGFKQMDGQLPDGYAEELANLVEERMNRRLQLIQHGVKVWDFSIAMCLIVSGLKV